MNSYIFRSRPRGKKYLIIPPPSLLLSILKYVRKRICYLFVYLRMKTTAVKFQGDFSNIWDMLNSRRKHYPTTSFPQFNSNWKIYIWFLFVLLMRLFKMIWVYCTLWNDRVYILYVLIEKGTDKIHIEVCSHSPLNFFPFRPLVDCCRVQSKQIK